MLEFSVEFAGKGKASTYPIAVLEKRTNNPYSPYDIKRFLSLFVTFSMTPSTLKSRRETVGDGPTGDGGLLRREKSWRVDGTVAGNSDISMTNSFLHYEINASFKTHIILMPLLCSVNDDNILNVIRVQIIYMFCNTFLLLATLNLHSVASPSALKVLANRLSAQEK